MRHVLCYGDSNTFGVPPIVDRGQFRRHGADERWTGVLARELGSGWNIIAEGLPGRTTVHDDPIEGADRNGKAFLRACLDSHRPLDAVALMLGTNDLKARFGVSAQDIADGLEVLLELVAASAAGPGGEAPRVLVIAPPPLARLELFADMFAGGEPKSRRLGGLYERLAARRGTGFLDAGRIIRCSDVDGVHLEAADHAVLGRAVAAALRALC